MSADFWIATVVVVATPGIGALYTIAAGLSRGACASILAAFACTLGIVPHLIAAITGLAAVLHASAVAFNLIRYLGVAYLVYLAVRTWRDRTPLVADEDDEPRAPLTVITQGVLINLLNPKLTIFFFAFLPQFVQSDVPGALAEMLVLSGIFMAVTFVVFAIYGVCAAFLRQHVLQRPRVVTWLRRSFAGAYFAFAARLAVSDR